MQITITFWGDLYQKVEFKRMVFEYFGALGDYWSRLIWLEAAPLNPPEARAAGNRP